jgi:hypothetical protein
MPVWPCVQHQKVFQILPAEPETDLQQIDECSRLQKEKELYLFLLQ